MLFRDAVIIPAPINKELFSLGNDSERIDAYLYAGVIMTHKGLHQILDFADGQPTKKFHFAGKAVSQELMDRIKAKHTYLGEFKHEDMPALYKKYKYFIVNPLMPESFSLATVEAIIMGCEIIKFQRSQKMGFESYQVSQDKLIDMCYKASETFWNKIETKCK
jgi:glycosyltransferase involved in cell wall biosynthesis